MYRLIQRGLLLLLLVGCLQNTFASSQLEFLYIDANEGSASGGHVALRLDDAVFHFQHVESGLLRLFRANYTDFCFQYGTRENRSIYAHRLSVSEVVFENLKETFERRLVIEDSQFQHLKALENELAFVQALLPLKQAQTADQTRVPIKALGYFVAVPWSVKNALPLSADSSPVTQQLRLQVQQQYGADFFNHQRQILAQQLHALKPTVIHEQLTQFDEQRLSRHPLYFAQQYQHILTNWAALQVLDAAAPILSEQLHTGQGDAFELDAQSLAALHIYQQRLQTQLLRLWQSERADWGQALLVGMARLQALAYSQQTRQLQIVGRQIVQDTPQIEFHAHATQRLQEAAEQELQQAKQLLDNRIALDEMGYAELETAANELLGVQRQIQKRQGFKAIQLTPIPARMAEVALLDVNVDPESLLSYQQQLQQRQQQAQARLQELYAYYLLQRNCVTELFRQIELTMARLAEPGESAQAASQRLLGGYIEDSGLSLIPFLAYERVAEQYRVTASHTLDAYRQRRIQQAYHNQSAWWLDVKESNVLSGQIYQWHSNDAAFLFFTQDAVWPRPIQGSFNLLTGAGQTLFGMLRWPWDHGLYLKKGLTGMLVSLPELVFFNIRKGSFPSLLPVTLSTDEAFEVSE